jgi:hypothetical protein
VAKIDPLALGVSVHTGWAACVVAAGSVRAPRIVARAEIELLADPDRFVFHRAAEMALEDGARSVARADATAASNARAALARIVQPLRDAGHAIVGLAIVANAAPMPASLAEIVAAHPRIHTAEGSFYRDALRAAAEAMGIPTRVIPPKQVDPLAAKSQRVALEDLASLLAIAGRTFGKPWSKDQKMSALAAWTLLAG